MREFLERLKSQIEGGPGEVEDFRSHARQQAAIAELGQQALSGLELPTLMNETSIIVARTLGVEFCQILEITSGGKSFLLRAGFGWKEGHVGRTVVEAGIESQAGFTLLSSVPVVVQDLRTEQRFRGPPFLLDHGVKSGLSVLIHGKHCPYGILGAHSTHVRTFTQSDIHFLQVTANLLAAAIHRKNNEEELVKKSSQIVLLQEVAVAANKAHTPEEAIRACLNKVCRFTGWPIGHVYFHDPTRGQLLPSDLWHLDGSGQFQPFRQVTLQTILAPNLGLPGRVLVTAKPCWVTDIDQNAKFPRQKVAELSGIRAAFAFPVLVRDEVAAVLEFFSQEASNPDEPLLEVMGQIGTQLGRVIERQRSELAIRENQQHSRLIVETANDAFVGMNAAGVIIDWNRQAELTFGWPREDVLGRILSETIIPSRFRRAHEAGLRNFLETGDCPVFHKRIELAAMHRSGREFPIELTVWPLPRGSSHHFYAFVHDITQRKKAETEFTRAESRYRTLVEQIPAITFLASLDEGNSEFYVSPQIETLLGITQKEWLDDPILWFKRVHPDDRERLQEVFAKTCVDGEVTNCECRLLGRNNESVWVQGHAKVIYDLEGVPAFIQGVAFDINERKRAEEDLRRLNATLEERVAERSAAAEDRARELARSNAELEQFAYVASHDLQEPLRMVASYTQLLGRRYRGRLDADADEFIRYAVDGASRMQGLIQDLLTYARVGAKGKEYTAVSSQAVLDRVLADLRGAMVENNASVTSSLLPTILGDDVQLGQLFQNLIANGIKFRREEPPHIHVSAHRQANSSLWHFSIKDNGIGMEPDESNRIFVIFKRLHTREKYPGTGIGLAVCKKIVERHGGEIWVESQPGTGSEFHFTLPAAEPDGPCTKGGGS